MNRRNIIIFSTVLIFSALIIFSVHYFALLDKPFRVGEIRQISQYRGENVVEVPYVVETVAEGLEVPWAAVWTSENRMLFTERPGRVRAIVDGDLIQKPLYVFEAVDERGEEGLMGVAISPMYTNNRHVFVSLVYPIDGTLRLQIVRLTDNGDNLVDPKIILDDVPAAQYHSGSAIEFGPDNKLYITTGDALAKQDAQDLESLAGKTLRINEDGSVPDDNPFPNSLVYSYGHRNSQGIDWHPVTGELYASEHGPSVFDGPAGGDEVNRVVSGQNYGWPLVSHEQTLDGAKDPLVVFTPAEAPASMLVYSGKVFPQFTNNLFFGALRGEGIVRLVLDSNNPDRIILTEKLAGVEFGRIRFVAEGPDGNIYFSTSNRDGRGVSVSYDDRIMRLVPKKN